MSIHYHPPWYPNHHPNHNPFSVPDTMTGKTHYEAWCDEIGAEELQRLIRKYHAEQRDKKLDNRS